MDDEDEVDAGKGLLTEEIDEGEASVGELTRVASSRLSTLIVADDDSLLICLKDNVLILGV